MRSLLMVCAVLCLALVAGVASAATPGQVPDATLAAFGLSGMQQMSDVQGTQVRGMGFAAVGGFSVARAPGGQIAGNGYVAVSDPRHGSALAAGASLSVAASGVGVFTPIGNVGVVVGGVAGGGAIAYAK
jgi:hypothetical protein